MTDQELLDGLDEMIAQAPGVGLCSLPFKIVRERVAEIIAERDRLKEMVAKPQEWGESWR